MEAAVTQRRKPQTHLLHRDFSLPVMNPGGSQRLLRFEAVDGKGDFVAGEHMSTLTVMARDNRRLIPRIGAQSAGGADDADDGGIKELREKLLGHLREAADRIKLEMSQIGPSAPPVAEIVVQRPEAKLESMLASDARMPWSLRTRRAAQRMTAASAISATKAAERTVRLRSEDPEKKELLKFSVTLSRDEIEEDVFAMTGSRPRRRPKKRARIVQRQLDAIFPGLWLSEISPDSYRVPE